MIQALAMVLPSSGTILLQSIVFRKNKFTFKIKVQVFYDLILQNLQTIILA